MADEVKAPSQEEVDSVLHDLVMARRVVTHIGSGVYVNHQGRKVNADGSEAAQTQQSSAASGTIFTDAAGIRYMMVSGNLMQIVEKPVVPPASISTPTIVSTPGVS